MKRYVILIAFLLTITVGLAGAQGANETGNSDRIANTGLFTPDSALYGLDTAWDNAGMAVGLKRAGDVAKERAAEAQAMAEKGDYESAQKAMDKMNSVAKRAKEEESEDIRQAESVLQGVIDDAPEEAQQGLQTAMENIQKNRPDNRGGPEEREPSERGQRQQQQERQETHQQQEQRPTKESPETPTENEPETDETDEEAASEEIEVEGGNYYFDPDTIEFEAGEEVTITLDNQEGFHDFRIPELDVGTEQFQGPGTRSFTFEIEEPGTYEFICSVGNHAQLGMTGTIEVTEG